MILALVVLYKSFKIVLNELATMMKSTLFYPPQKMTFYSLKLRLSVSDVVNLWLNDLFNG